MGALKTTPNSSFSVTKVLPIRHIIDLLVFARFYGSKDLPFSLKRPIIEKVVEAIKVKKKNNIRNPWILNNGLSLRVFLLNRRGEIFAPSISLFPNTTNQIKRWLEKSVEASFCSKCGTPDAPLYLIAGKTKWAKIKIECGKVSIEGSLQDKDLDETFGSNNINLAPS